MGEITVTRGTQRRPGRLVVSYLVLCPVVAFLAIQALVLAWQGSVELAGATPIRVALFAGQWLVLFAIIGLLVRLMAPLHQMLRSSRDPDDVVLAIDDRGVRLADGGCQLAAPWSAISELELQPRSSDEVRLHLVASGPVQVSDDALGRTLARRVRRTGLDVRLRLEQPQVARLAEAIAHHHALIA